MNAHCIRLKEKHILNIIFLFVYNALAIIPFNSNQISTIVYCEILRIYCNIFSLWFMVKKYNAWEHVFLRKEKKKSNKVW